MVPMFFKLVRLGWSRFHSPERYRELQQLIAEETIVTLNRYGIHLEDMEVLELGSGHGGYSLCLKRASRSFVAGDLQAFHIYTEEGIPFVTLDACGHLPFKSSRFDLVYSSSLIEHLSFPLEMLSESWRVLRPGGKLFLSFPPFYSLLMVGGHQFKPAHFLGERAAVAIFNWRYRNRSDVRPAKDYAACFESYGLHRLGIDQVTRMLTTSGFKLVHRFTRLSRFNTTGWPGFLKDLATWHACFLAEKPR
jgi:SAM-dependent methyltransferase